MSIVKYRGCTIESGSNYGRNRWWTAYGSNGLPLRYIYANANYLSRELDGPTIESVKYLIDTQTFRDVPKVKRTRKVIRIKTPRIVSDGGRRAHGFDSERNDCVVRAIAHARCISYADAHALCRDKFHREDKRGTFSVEPRLAFLSWAKRVAFKGTLDAFALAHPRGHYIVVTCNHATAVCDGAVYDAGFISGLCRVESAFEVTA